MNRLLKRYNIDNFIGKNKFGSLCQIIRFELKIEFLILF